MLVDAKQFEEQIGSGLPGAMDNVVLGDCLPLLRLLPDSSIDLIHTSPPYNIDKPYKSNRRDREDLTGYTAFLADVISECRRVLKPNGSLFWQTGYTDMPGGIEGDILPIDHLTERFFREGPNPMIIWDRIIWRYLGGMAFKKKFTNRHETILWFVKIADGEADPIFNVDAVRESSRSYDRRNNLWGRNPGNVWEHDRVAFGSIEQTSHIAVYPLAIAERIVLACSREGDIVLDPMSGSGTTLVAARSHGRHWIGFEISKEYALESVRRIGYTQPDPVSGLAAAILAQSVFEGQPGQKPLSEAIDRFLSALQPRQINQKRVDFDSRLATVLPNGPSGREVKDAKQATWEYFDHLIAEAKSDPIVQFHRLLDRSYPLRKELNGLSAYKSTLELTECLIKRVTPKLLPDYIRELAANAPSMFEVINTQLCLRSLERRVKTVNERSRPEILPLQMTGGI